MKENLTKEHIRNTFTQMLNEKSLNNITIKELVARCDINRNTFYYHYADIYELLSEVFQIELEKAIAEYNQNLSWEEGFLVATTFGLENKKAVYHVYNSMQREELENFIYGIAGMIMSRYVNQENESIQAPREDVALIVMFYQAALTGIVMSWVSTGMKQDPNYVIGRIGTLFNGTIQQSLKRSAEESKPK